jgi:hypothetical protein
MIRTKVKILLLTMAVLLLCGPVVQAQGAPGVTITAPTSITLIVPSGNQPTTVYAFQLSSVNNYVGNVLVNCRLKTVNANATTPPCVIQPALPHAIPLTAGENYTGSFNFTASFIAKSATPVKGGALVVAALLCMGLTLRRRARKLGLLALLTAAGVAITTVSGCSGGNANLANYTPGSYTYVLAASDIATGNQLATTQFTLIIPNGE